MRFEYRSKEDLEQICSFLHDAELNELYQKVRTKDSNFFIREILRKRFRFNYTDPAVPLEELWTDYEIIHCHGMEAQIISVPFESDQVTEAFLKCHKRTVRTYMVGYLNGISCALKNNEK